MNSSTCVECTSSPSEFLQLFSKFNRGTGDRLSHALNLIRLRVGDQEFDEFATLHH